MNKHTFTLANGDEITVFLCESGYGVEGYRLKIVAASGNLVIHPNADNALTVSTDKAEVAESAAKGCAIRDREALRTQQR